MKAVFRPGKKIPLWFAVILVLLPVITGLICLTVGRYHLTVIEVLNALIKRAFGTPLEETVNSVVFNLRLPRILLAIFIGAGLGASGAAFQGLFGNPLATPDTLGVTAGSSVGAIIALLMNAKLMVVQVMALMFGLGSVALTVAVARRKGKTSVVMLVLSGVIVSALLSAVVSILKYTADPLSKLPAITFWLMGSLASVTYRGLLLGTPLIVVGAVILYLLRWRLNILTLSEDEARTAGIRVQRLRIAVVVASTLVTASCVSMCGQVGWVGLLIPHCARMLCGGDNRFVIPLSLSFGAVFMLLVDTIARSVISAEIPISVLTAIIGAPFFISLLRKTGGGWR